VSGVLRKVVLVDLSGTISSGHCSSMINSNVMPNIALKTLLKEPNDIMKYVAELEIQPLHGYCQNFYTYVKCGL
jgi:hypothetical protein